MPNHFPAIFIILDQIPVGAHPCDRPMSTKDHTSIPFPEKHKIRIKCRGDTLCSPGSTQRHTSTHPTEKREIRANTRLRPYGTSDHSLGRIIQTFKSMTTNEYIRGVKTLGWPPFNKKLWQRNYYEHIIRNEKSLHEIRDYILKNPAMWELDPDNIQNVQLEIER
jgi:hypothetical protein